MAMLFNHLPAKVANITGVKTDTFKHHLDRWIRTVPDTPRIDNYSASVEKQTNSLLDQASATLIWEVAYPSKQLEETLSLSLSNSEEIEARARVMLGWALRTFSTRDQSAMITIWNAQIRPIFDYCSPLWSPCPNNYKNIELLEGTQRSFTRCINGMEGLDYAQRLKALKLYSTQRRQERYKIIYIYKIKEKMVPNISTTHGLQFFNSKRHGCFCRMPSYPLYHNRAVIARNSSFALTASSLWNCLPKHIRNISGLSVEAFKNKLDKALRLYPDEPRCSASGVYADEHGRASNSLVDISKNKEVKKILASIFQEDGLPRWSCPKWRGAEAIEVTRSK